MSKRDDYPNHGILRRAKLVTEHIKTVFKPCQCEQCRNRREILKQYTLDSSPLRRAKTIWQHHRHKGEPPCTEDNSSPPDY